MPKLTNGDRSVRGLDGVRITPPTLSATASFMLSGLFGKALVGVAEEQRVARLVGDVLHAPHDVAEKWACADIRDDQRPDPVTTGTKASCDPAGTIARSFTACTTVAAKRDSTCGWLLSTLETVAVETPAARATSTMVVIVGRCYSRGLGAPTGTDVRRWYSLRLDIEQ